MAMAEWHGRMGIKRETEPLIMSAQEQLSNKNECD